MPRWTLWVMMLALAGCAGNPRTKYQPYQKDEGGGYTQESLDGVRLVSFKANSYTKKGHAELFAKFRAVEVCKEEGKKFAHIVGVSDRSDARTITRTNADVYGFPSYYYGMSPWHRYSGVGFSMGFNTVQSQSWQDTLVYPEIDVLYHCEDEVYEPEVIFREVPAEEMKHLVKDLKGGMQVEKILENSPNKNILEKGDIILKGDGERISHGYQVLGLFKKNRQVPVELLREGERKRVVLKSAEVTAQVEKSQQELISAACKFKEIKDRGLCK